MLGKGDCGSYTALLVAALQHVGMPARAVSGYWRLNPFGIQEGTHAWVEFMIPSVAGIGSGGWVPADPSYSDTHYPDSHLGFYFGIVPHLRELVAMEIDTDIATPIDTFSWLQGLTVTNSPYVQNVESRFEDMIPQIPVLGE